MTDDSTLQNAINEMVKDVRRRAHSERNRIHRELDLLKKELASGTDPLDATEPNRNRKVVRHHENVIPININQKKKIAYQKRKWWKRRKKARHDKYAEEYNKQHESD